MPKRYIVSIMWEPQIQYNDWQTKIELFQIRKEYKLKLAPISILPNLPDKVHYGVYCNKGIFQKEENILSRLNGFVNDSQKILKNKGIRDVTIEIIYPN